MLKVTKFGGSSLCDSAGFSRVREIVLADHHQKAAAGMVVLLVLTQMLGQGVDPGSEDSDLNLGRTGITGMGRVLLDNGSFFFFAHHSCVSTFQNIPGIQVSGRQKTCV